MANLEIKRVPQRNIQTKELGFITKAVEVETASLEKLSADAARNTTLNPAELEMGIKLFCQGAARALAEGKALDLGPLGTISPKVTSKWTKTAEEQTKNGLTKSVAYKPGADIDHAIQQAELTWVKTDTDTKAEAEDTADNDGEGESPAGDSSNTTNGNTQQGDGSNTPTDPTKILLLFNDGAHGNAIVKRMEVAPGYQLQASDLPDGYVYAFKNDDQADIDAATAGEAVWVTLSPRG